MPKLEFVGQSSRDPGNVAASTGRLVNLFREATDGRMVLRSVPGTAEFVEFGRANMSAMAVIEGILYVVCGGRLFSTTTAGVVTELGAVAAGDTTIAGNYGLVTITSGGSYYVWNGTTLASIPIGDVEGGPAEWVVGSLAYVGGYTVVSEQDARRLQWSALADAESMPGLNFATSESTDEVILRVITFGDSLVVFKENSAERWLVTGLSGANAFQLITGSVLETGLQAFNLVTQFPNGAAFVSSDGRVYAWNGDQLQPISTPQVEAVMALHTAKRCFFYEVRGHGMICITFADAPAWCYDVAMGEWHERAEGVNFGPWTAAASEKFGGGWVVGYDSGRVGVLAKQPLDFGAPLKRTAVTRLLQTGRRFTVPKLELNIEVGSERRPLTPLFLVDEGNLIEAIEGFFLADGGPDSGPPSIQCRVTRDGVSYGPEKVRSLGDVGRYETRVIFRAMGQFTRMALEVSMTAAVETPLYADLDVEIA